MDTGVIGTESLTVLIQKRKGPINYLLTGPSPTLYLEPFPCVPVAAVSRREVGRGGHTVGPGQQMEGSNVLEPIPLQRNLKEKEEKLAALQEEAGEDWFLQ